MVCRTCLLYLLLPSSQDEIKIMKLNFKAPNQDWKICLGNISLLWLIWAGILPLLPKNSFSTTNLLMMWKWTLSWLISFYKLICTTFFFFTNFPFLLLVYYFVLVENMPLCSVLSIYVTWQTWFRCLVLVNVFPMFLKFKL